MGEIQDADVILTKPFNDIIIKPSLNLEWDANRQVDQQETKDFRIRVVNDGENTIRLGDDISYTTPPATNPSPSAFRGLD